MLTVRVVLQYYICVRSRLNFLHAGARLTPVKRMLDNFICPVLSPFSICRAESVYRCRCLQLVSLFPVTFLFLFPVYSRTNTIHRPVYVESTNDISDGLEGNIGISGRDFVGLCFQRFVDAIVSHVCALTFSNSGLSVWNFSNWI